MCGGAPNPAPPLAHGSSLAAEAPRGGIACSPWLPCGRELQAGLLELLRAGVWPLLGLLGGLSPLFGHGASQRISSLPARLWRWALLGAGLHAVQAALLRGVWGDVSSIPGVPLGAEGLGLAAIPWLWRGEEGGGQHRPWYLQQQGLSWALVCPFVFP